jgi:hypothetical protein
MPLIIPEPPEYSTCWFCNTKYQGFHTRETEVQYNCPKHPLYTDWYCVRQTAGKWFFNRIVLTLPGHFRLHWNFHAGPNFTLDEWLPGKANMYGSHWQTINANPHSFPFQPTGFPAEYILTQSPERLHSLLQLYKTFS